MALLQGPQLQNASFLGFWMSEEELFILISTSTSFSFSFLSWPPYLLGSNATQVSPLCKPLWRKHWCFSLLGEDKQKRRMERETCLAQEWNIFLFFLAGAACESRAAFSDPSVCRQALPSLGLARELQEPALARCGSRCSSAEPGL